MSKSDELSAKAAKLMSRSSSGTTDLRTAVAPEKPKSVPAARPRTVRLSVDIPAEEHLELNQWAFTAAGELGVTRVHGQELVRSLIHKALNDPVLRAAITESVGLAREARA